LKIIIFLVVAIMLEADNNSSPIMEPEIYFTFVIKPILNFNDAYYNRKVAKMVIKETGKKKT